MHRLLREPAAATRLLASSVVRGARLHDSHGGLCVVDCRSGAVDWVLDWNAPDIDFEERGGDRGLRGIGIAGDNIYVLSSVALIRFDRNMRVLATYRNPYLKHCHELSIHDGRAYIVSTGFDAIISFDLASERFVEGAHLCVDDGALRAIAFDPASTGGPAPVAAFHLNSVLRTDEGLYFSGLRTGGLLCIAGAQFSQVAPLPTGTHNARPFGDGIIYNDTESNRLCVKSAGRDIELPVSADPAARQHWQLSDDSRLARPLFARGLCLLSPTLVAAGSSPSTVSIYDLAAEQLVARIELSRDVRNAVHGLTIWPFDV